MRKFYYQLLLRKKKLYLNKLVENGLVLGTNVSFAGDVFLDPSHCYLIKIGNNCTFAPGVRIIAHDASSKQFLGYTRFAAVEIGDNCFLGDSVIVLPGVSIGSDVIVGAGAVVSKDIPSNSVAVGSPAKVIRSLDDYLRTLKAQKAERPLFDVGYHIENLDKKKRKELIEVATTGGGFID